MAAKVFLKNLMTHMEQLDSAWVLWPIDHLAFRTTKSRQYERLKRFLATKGQLMSEAYVSGRPIAIFHLDKPIRYQSWLIRDIEVISPKQGTSYPRGWDHIEILAQMPLERMLAKFKRKEQVISSVVVDKSPGEVDFRFAKGRVKVHYLPLTSLIHIEKQESLTQAYNNFVHLSGLGAHDPLLAGSLPVGLYMSNSDLDVLVGHTEWQTFSKDFFEKIKTQATNATYKLEADYALINLAYRGVPFEIYFAEKPPILQRAGRHLQIEARLIQLFPRALQILKKLRTQGMKTEPAFAQAFHIEGDPYEELERWSNLTDANLYDVVSKLHHAFKSKQQQQK